MSAKQPKPGVSSGANAATAPEASADEENLTVFVQNLLQQMQSRFQQMSDTIVSRIDEMGGRIDDLERSIGDLMAQAGIADDREHAAAIGDARPATTTPKS
ncbi:Heat shock factor binding protein 1 [Plasmodiophora brassicae]